MSLLNRRVDRIMLTAVVADGRRLELVGFDDGQLGVRRDGDVLLGFVWDRLEIDQAVDTFLWLCDPSAGPPPKKAEARSI